MPADTLARLQLPKRAFAIVLAGGRGSRLKQLIDRRAKPAVYFGGKFRIVDFALSNFLNSGIRQIGIATQYKSHSLWRHLQRGWSFLKIEMNESIDLLLQQLDADHLLYHSPKPHPEAPGTLVLTPLEFIDRIAALVPPPRAHRHRYYGVLAPNASLRVAVTALAPVAIAPSPPPADAAQTQEEPPHRAAARYPWTMQGLWNFSWSTARTCGFRIRVRSETASSNSGRRASRA